MNLDSFFPRYLTDQSPWLFLLHFVFVVLIFLGQYFLLSLIQKRKKIFDKALLEAFLFVPFFLLPFGLLFYCLHWGNFFYGFLQTIFILSAIVGIYRYHREWNRQWFKNIGWTEWIIYGFIFVVGYFGWIVPIPDQWNGHAHILFNVLTQMLQTGHFEIPDKSHLSTPDIVQLFWPPHLTFLLRYYSLNHPLFFYRSALLVPLFISFLSVQLIKAICELLNFPKQIGLLGYLSLIGTYFHSLTLYEIQYDTFSLLMLLYSLYLLARICIKKENVFLQVLFLLSLSFLMRRSVFLILFFSTCFVLIVYFRQVRRILQLRLPAVLLAVFPVLVWSSIGLILYGNPLYPECREQVDRWLQRIGSNYAVHQTVDLKGVFPERKENGKGDEKEGKSEGARIRYFGDLVDKYFHHHPWIRFAVGKGGSLFAFLVRAGPLSFTLAGLFFILLLVKKIEISGKEFWILEGILAGGCLTAYLLFLQGHTKFPQHLAVVTLFPAGFILHFVQKKFLKSLPMFLAMAAFLSFNVMLFGHHNIDFHFSPAQILLGQKTFVEKLAFKSNESVLKVENEVRELGEARQSGKRVLHMDVEPGAWLPAMMGKEFLGKAFYFSTFNYPLKDILTAKNKGALALALEQRDIRFIFIPQKSHGELDAHPLSEALKKLQQQSSYHLVAPVHKVLESIQF